MQLRRFADSNKPGNGHKPALELDDWGKAHRDAQSAQSERSSPWISAEWARNPTGKVGTIDSGSSPTRCSRSGRVLQFQFLLNPSSLAFSPSGSWLYRVKHSWQRSKLSGVGSADSFDDSLLV